MLDVWEGEKSVCMCCGVAFKLGRSIYEDWSRILAAYERNELEHDCPETCTFNLPYAVRPGMQSPHFSTV